MTQSDYDVIVIGGGPSGMMAAGTAAARGKHVLLLEKNRHLGDKLKITGGGRCNITNAEPDLQKLLDHYGGAKDFLFSPFARFGVSDTFKFFESRGLPLVVEARQRVFPATQKAADVFRVMDQYLQEYKVTVRTNAKVTKVIAADDEINAVQAGKEHFYGRAFVFATGGMSHPETGATGDGFDWLRHLGYTVKEPSPDIVPLAVADKWVRDLSGTSLSFMKITFYLEGKKQFVKKGKILFTHFGLSGPLILNSAREVKELLRGGEVTATIDLYPDTDLGALEKEVIKVFDKNKNKNFKNIFGDIVPDGTDKALLPLLGAIDPESKVHSITKEERKLIVQKLKNLPLTVTGLMGFDRAVVADGGVNLREIDMRTMRSRRHRNLFITGDLLDITRPSGGFSLQLCWTTGYVAGLNVGD